MKVLFGTKPLVASIVLSALAACSQSAAVRYGYLHAGDVSATNLLGTGEPDDASDDQTFSQCLVEVLRQDDDSLLISIGSARNVALIFEVDCSVGVRECIGDSSKGTLRAGLFRLGSAAPAAVMDVIRSVAADNGAAALFGDPRCLAMSGTVELTTDGERVARAKFSLESTSAASSVADESGTVKTSTRGAPKGSSRTTISGEIIEYRQRLDPGGALR
jgi:hypothetical protein